MSQSDRPALSPTALESALLVLGAYFLATAGCGWAAALPLSDTGLWLLRGLLPPLVLAAGACWVIRRHRPPVTVLRPRPGLIGFLFSALLLGAGGGIWAGATSIDLLAAGLPQGARLPWALGWVGLLVPIIEETYFRGVLQAAVMRFVGGQRPDGACSPESRGPRAWLAVVAAIGVPAVVFALAHLGSPQTPVLLLMGLGLGVLQYWSGSLVVPILGHMAWNLATVSYGLHPGMGDLAMPLALPGAMWLSMSLLVHYRSVMGLGRATP
jgi:membrane protease YdiL (CAAX protease family)